MFESVLHDRLLKHCLENEIITQKQAAYLKGDSTVSQLLYIVHKIRKTLSDKNISQGIFLDVVLLLTKFGTMVCLPNWAKLVLRDPSLTLSAHIWQADSK